MRTKLVLALIVVLFTTFCFSGCMSQKKTGCVPEKARGNGTVKFKGFL